MTTNNEYPKEAEALAKEPSTPGMWAYVFDSNKSIDSAEAHLLVAFDEGFQAEEGDRIKEGTKMQCVAHFHRPADARRVVACIRAFLGMPTEAIEALPEPIGDMLARIVRGQLAAAQLAEKAQSEDAWIQLRQDILDQLNRPRPTAH